MGKVRYIVVKKHGDSDEHHSENKSHTGESHNYEASPAGEKEGKDVIGDTLASMAGYEEYIAKYGTHFNDSLATWASEKMTNSHGDANHHWSVEDVKSACERLGLKKPEESTWGDVAYSANMHYADYFGSSLKSEADCIKQAYADVSDPDGYPGKIFNRWTSDIIGKRVKVPWKNHI